MTCHVAWFLPIAFWSCKVCRQVDEVSCACAFWCSTVSRLESLAFLRSRSVSLHTVQSTLYTLHHCTPCTPHSTLYTSLHYTLHFTLHTSHRTLHTIPLFTLHTSFFILCTLHSTLFSPLSTLYLYTLAFQSALHTSHSALHTLHLTLRTLQSTCFSSHLKLHTTYLGVFTCFVFHKCSTWLHLGSWALWWCYLVPSCARTPFFIRIWNLFFFVITTRSRKVLAQVCQRMFRTQFCHVLFVWCCLWLSVPFWQHVATDGWWELQSMAHNGSQIEVKQETEKHS